MTEIEVKILEIDKDRIIRILENAWAEKTFNGEIIAEFFWSPQKKIRLRRMESTNVLTFKHPISMDNGMKCNEEHETEFESYETLSRLLPWLGYEKYGDSKKHRISYHLNGLVFDIDKYDGVPWFVEVEATSAEKVEEWVKLLGYSMEQTCDFWEAELKRHYGNIPDQNSIPA